MGLAYWDRCRNIHPARGSVITAISTSGQSWCQIMLTSAPFRNILRKGYDVAQRIEQGADLEPVGHVFDGGGEAGKNDRRHLENKGSEESLLHGHRQGRHHQSEAH